MQFVQRHRFEVEYASQRVQLLPCTDQQRGEIVVCQSCVFRIGIGLPYAFYGERIGSEERTVDIVVARADVVDAASGRPDAVLQNAIADDQFAVVAVDAIDFGRIEEIGEDRIDDRYEDESQQNLAQQFVRSQPERRGHRLVCKRIGFVGEGFDGGFPGKSFHGLKNCFDSCKFSVNCVILQPELPTKKQDKTIYDGIE